MKILLLVILHIQFGFMLIIGIIDIKPIKILAPLNVRGPILSIPVSWAINVVPQINVQSNALINDKDLDIF